MVDYVLDTFKHSKPMALEKHNYEIKPLTYELTKRLVQNKAIFFSKKSPKLEFCV